MSAESLLEVVLRAHRAGLCVVPPTQDGSKKPISRWKEYQSKRPTEDQLLNAYSNGRTGIGFICGEISGGLELFDFDDREVFEAFLERARDAGLDEIINKLEAGYMERTPNGAHFFYRCATPECGKLAQRRIGGGKIKALIELKGEGGYAIVAPSNGSVHPSGQPYVLVSGSIETIPTISPIEREELHRIARTFDEVPRQKSEGQPQSQPSRGGELRPGDDYNARGSWDELLERHGWIRLFERNGETYWRRPGKSEGISATTNYNGSGLFYCFSTSTLFETERGYSLFGVLALLEHDGDFAAAARSLAAAGYGSQRKKTATDPSPAKPVDESWEPPIRFDDFDPAPFPVDALPKWVRDWVEAESTAAQVPADLPAVVALGVFSTAVAGKAKVRVKTGYTEPLNM